MNQRLEMVKLIKSSKPNSKSREDEVGEGILRKTRQLFLFNNLRGIQGSSDLTTCWLNFSGFIMNTTVN